MKRGKLSLIVLVVLLAVFAGVWSLRQLGGVARPVVAVAETVSANVEHRPAASERWSQLVPKTEVKLGDAVRAPAGNGAVLRMVDGSSVIVGEDTHVVFAPATGGDIFDILEEEKGIVIDLHAGAVAAAAGQKDLTVKVQDRRVVLGRDSAATLFRTDAEHTRLTVRSGRALLVDVGGMTKEVLAAEGARFDSTASQVDKLAVALLSPEAGSRLFLPLGQMAVTFGWRATVPPPQRFQLAADPGFTRIVHEARCEVEAERVAGLAAGIYYWRVLGKEAGTGEDMSEVRWVTLVEDSPPVLQRPDDGGTVIESDPTPPRFAWQPIDGVGGFVLEIAFDERFEHIIRRLQVTGNDSVLLPGLEEAFYHWRVKADAPDRPSAPFSPPRRFRYLHKPLPKPPTPLPSQFELPSESPAKPPKRDKSGWLFWLIGGEAWAAEETRPAQPSVVLRWEAVGDAAHYLLEIASDQAFTQLLVNTELLDPSYHFSVEANRTYYWRVRSIDANHRQGDYSPTRTVSTFASAPKLAAPKNRARIEARDELPAVDLAWERAGFALAFLVEVAAAPSFAAPLMHVVVQSPRARYRPKAPGTYFWRVRSEDPVGPFSEPWRFEVPSRAREEKKSAASAPASTQPASSPASQAVEEPPLPKEQEKWVMLALGFGLVTNFTVVVSPALYLEAGALLPVVSRRLAIVLRASGHFSRIANASEPGASAVEYAAAFSLCLRYAHPFSLVTLSAVLGPALGVAYAEINVPPVRSTAVQALAGIDGGIGVARTLGPGEIFIEIAYRWLRHNSATVGFDAGGLLAVAGYRISL